jgi:hypothetical protein
LWENKWNNEGQGERKGCKKAALPGLNKSQVERETGINRMFYWEKGFLRGWRQTRPRFLLQR